MERWFLVTVHFVSGVGHAPNRSGLVSRQASKWSQSSQGFLYFIRYPAAAAAYLCA